MRNPSYATSLFAVRPAVVIAVASAFRHIGSDRSAPARPR
jgi:hypothetical protein